MFLNSSFRSFNINDTSELSDSFMSTATMEANNAYQSEAGIIGKGAFTNDVLRMGREVDVIPEEFVSEV